MDFPLLRVLRRGAQGAGAISSSLATNRTQHRGGPHRVPFVDISRIETEAEKQIVMEIIAASASIAQANGVELHLETDLDPGEFAALFGTFRILV